MRLIEKDQYSINKKNVSNMNDFVIKNLPDKNEIREPSPLYVENIRLIIANILAQNKISGVKIEVFPGIWYTKFIIDVLMSISKDLVQNICDDIETFFVSKLLRVTVIRKDNGHVQLEIEIPNDEVSIIGLKSVLESDAFRSCTGLPIGVGVTNDNKPFILDLCDFKDSNILVCGSTGAGSNVFTNMSILSLLASKTSDELKFVFIAKEGRLDVYNDLNKDYFLPIENLTPQVITNPDLSVYAIDELSKLIEERNMLFKHFKVKTIKEFNEKKPELKFPQVVVIINDYDNLFKHNDEKIAQTVARIAKYGYWSGVNVILKTDKPEPQFFPDFVRLNFQCHICFKLPSTLISKIIIGESDASKLIGRGDMLVKSGDHLVRVMCSYINYIEIKPICEAS